MTVANRTALMRVTPDTYMHTRAARHDPQAKGLAIARVASRGGCRIG
jgi:hypothetical protein